MQSRIRWAAALPLAAALIAAPAGAQQLTVERILTTSDFRPTYVGVEWADDGESLLAVESDGGSGTDLWVQGIRTGRRTRLVEGAALRLQGADAPVQIEDFAFSADRSKLLIFTNSQQVWRARTKGTYYVYDLQTARLTPVSTRPGWQMFAKLSPDGRRVGFVRDNDLWVTDLATGQETRLTQDGSDVIINGTTDWVYEEELGLRDAWRWSPDGSRIAFWRLDQSDVPPFTWVDDLAGQYSRPVALRYPKAGEAPARARIGVIELASGATTWMETGGAPDDYLARMEWVGQGELVIQRLNRLQNRIDVLLADAGTGQARVAFSDTDPAWVDVDDDLTPINGGRQFLWTSEREGYNQIYLYDRSGRQVRRLTGAAWDVLAINGVDERGGWVYFTGTGGNPAEQQLFRVRLNGRGLQRLTREPGTHSVSLSPDASSYVATHSRAGVPPVSRLFRADGTLIRVLEENGQVAANLAAAGLNRPEFFSFRAPDGESLNGWMIKPANFDPSRRYPVLMYVYGTPGAQTVTDAWGGTRYLWHQLLAERGYIVASVDARGSSGRGRAFEKAGYLRQGEVVTDDQIAAARYLGSLPFVDAGRIGMWGWSGGGYTTGLALARGGNLFKAGVSVAPVTDWRLYDNIYTERFMRTPAENPEGYDRTSVVKLAPGITADYLLIHGTADDNVHFQNAVQLAAALQAAGKPFDFMLYPNRNHALPGQQTQLHLYNLMTRWLQEHL